MPFTPHPDYDDLPEAIKCMYTPEEYAWMPDAQRLNLVHDECMPEVEED